MPLVVGIDVGGTFTDLVALDEERGVEARVKVPSVPVAPEAGALVAVDDLLTSVRADDIVSVTHSTTIATNALLGQVGLELPRVVLFTTEGFRDVIEIGRQNRSSVYDLNVTRPRPLVAAEDRIGVRERMDHCGAPIVPLTEAACADAAAELRRRNDVRSVAISLLHAYANDAHERVLATALREACPDVDVSLSSEIDPMEREYERTSTTVVNAALRPLLRRYLDDLERGLRRRHVHAPLFVMQSAGGVVAASAAQVRPASIIESGPASGVIGAAALARELDIPRALSFDMGGTTAKAGAIHDGVPAVAGEFEAAGRTHSGRAVRGSGYPVRFPFVDLAEVSAGGGTIAFVDAAGALRVGPLSAGADPGPAAYGKSTVPTVTDANIVLGRLDQHALLGGRLPVDGQRSWDAVARLASSLGTLTIPQTAAGIVRLVDDQMAKALRIVTVERGDDPREHALIAFGGGGPLHVCALADDLAIRTIVVPPFPGLFSAHGLLVADLRVTASRSIPSLAAADAAAIEALFATEERRGLAEVRSQGIADSAILTVREIDVRYAGQSFDLTLRTVAPFDEAARRALIAAFHDLHRRRYGYATPDEPVSLVSVRSTVVGARHKPRFQAAPANGDACSKPQARREVFFENRFLSTPVYRRALLRDGDCIAGPAIVEQDDSCTVLPPGWSCDVHTSGCLLLRRS